MPLKVRLSEDERQALRARVAAAFETRKLKKQRAQEAAAQEAKAADDEVFAVIKDVREAGLPWAEVSEAAGISRQALLRMGNSS